MVHGSDHNGSESFYDQVYDLVRRVPPGSIVTYGQIAVLLGSPAAARAVGYALSYLPSSEHSADVPWWRVINARGEISLKGRSASAELQRQLLESEGIVFSKEGRTRLSDYRWWPEEDAEAPPVPEE